MKLKFKKVIVIALLFIQLFPYCTALAAEFTIEEARNAIASYAYNFYKSHAEEIYYYCPGQTLYRNKAYLDKTKYNKSTFSEDTSGDYILDCVGWVNFCVRYSTGLKCGITSSNVSSSWLCFSSPQTPTGQTSYFETVSVSNNSELQPGDLISLSNTHIMVYVGDTEDGNDMIVHSAYGDSLSYGTVTESQYDQVVRLKSSALDDITELDTSGDPLNISSSESSDGSVNIDMADFYYNGIPDGKYSVTKSVFERIIDNLSGIFDYLIGILTMSVRMVFVGWTAIIENLITSTVKSVVGEDDIDMISVTSTEIDSGDNITIEKIVFNQINIFDVNFFNFNEEKNNDNSEVTSVRQ